MHANEDKRVLVDKKKMTFLWIIITSNLEQKTTTRGYHSINTLLKNPDVIKLVHRGIQFMCLHACCHTIQIMWWFIWWRSLGANSLIAARAYPGFCRMKERNPWHPFILLGGDRHCYSWESCPRTQHNVPGQGLNPDHSLQERSHWPFRHCTSHVMIHLLTIHACCHTIQIMWRFI